MGGLRRSNKQPRANIGSISASEHREVSHFVEKGVTVTLLCHVKGACERVAAQNRVELTSDVAFQAPEDFSFCPALFSPSSGVRLGPLIDP